MSVKRGLGADPLDALTTEAPPVAPVGSVGQVGNQPAKPRKTRLEPIKLDGEVVDLARDAVWALWDHGQHTASLKMLAEEAIREKIARLQGELNDGQPFRRRGQLPRGGRVQPPS